MTIPFLKAHGAKNDFLLTAAPDVPPGVPPADLARAICDRHTGIGADGWLHVATPVHDADGEIRLFNADGSMAEISGNGTRCAAAFLIHRGAATASHVRIRTGAGVKHLGLLHRDGLRFTFEMNMGAPEIRARNFALPLSGGARDVTLVWVGNPQCALPVENFDFDWRRLGAEIEQHPHFPDHTNVSFFCVLDEHSLDVRFYERGAGETMSSGTGSTGAVAAAMARGMVRSPVTVNTPAGPLELRANPTTGEISLVGPAEIVGEGVFHCERIDVNGVRTRSTTARREDT
ncbi:MAG: diaminopimelate epimerase [Acidobacteriia bacterium]|nr:diaminopimelate epimerase [Terriglobia bacterium]